MTERGVISREDAKFSGKHCVTAAVDGAIVSQLFDLQEEAEAVLPDLRSRYPRARVAYWPSKEQWDRWEHEHIELSKWYVTFWYVLEARPIGDGKKAHDIVGPMFGTEDRAEEFLEQIRPEHPEAYLVEATRLFHRDHDKDMAEREKLLERLE